MPKNPIADSLMFTLQSPNEADSNLEPANVVDGLFFLARALDRLSQSLQTIADKMPAPTSTNHFPGFPDPLEAGNREC